MKLRCVVIDDEPLALDLLCSYVEKTPFLQLLARYSSAVEAMEEMKRLDGVHLLFLDIQMPGLDGLEFARMVSRDTKIIFTTAFDRYALDSYKVHALDYLLKPISYSDFLHAVRKAVEWFELTTREAIAAPVSSPATVTDFIFVRSDYKLIRIPLADILYIEGLKDYIKIYLDREPKPVTTLMSLKAIEEKLPRGRFVRVHRSFIVQKEKIRIVDRSRIVFDKQYIPISESYRQELQDYLAGYSAGAQRTEPEDDA